MSCKCDMRTKVVGDGCKLCNPQHYIDIIEDQTKDDCSELDKLEETILTQQATIERLTEQRDRLLEMLNKMKTWIHPKHISTDGEYLGDVSEMKALIAEVEAGK